MVKLLTHLGQLPRISKISPRTEESYCQGWQRAKEQTSSSPSGIHFSHYIAGIKELVVEMINQLMSMITGISPLHWCKTLNVMLEKLVGNCLVKKLCIIMLFKVDFNNNNKWLGCKVMANAEFHLALAPEQYSSCKGKVAGIQCLNK